MTKVTNEMEDPDAENWNWSQAFSITSIFDFSKMKKILDIGDVII